MNMSQFHPDYNQPKPTDKDKVDRERFIYLRDNLVLMNQRLESIDKKLSAPRTLANVLLVVLAIGFLIALLVVLGFIELATS